MRYLKLCIAACLILAGAVPAQAISYQLDPLDIPGMVDVWSSPAGGTGSYSMQIPDMPYPTFKYTGTLAQDAGSGWSQVQIGYRWTPSGSAGATSMNGHAFPDLSLFDDWALSFHNQLTGYGIKVNMWINTGYTDAPWSENPSYAQVDPTNNGWAELWLGDWTVLTLDFSDADVYEWDVATSTTKHYKGVVPNLDHVTGIGIVVAWDDTDGDYDDLLTGIQDYPYHVDIDLVPEPLTMLGVFGGVAFVGGYLRKRRTAV